MACVATQRITKNVVINKEAMHREIEVNKVSKILELTVPTTEETIRTMRSYMTMPTVKIFRLTTTLPNVISKTCLLKPEMGPCRASIPMWYFDPKTKNCSSFYWGGCQGNGNRFDKYSDCIGNCVSGKDWKRPQPRYCLLNFDYGWCFGSDERWYYDRQWKVCKKTLYSGCGGNKNNFYSREKCEDRCRFATFYLDKPEKVIKDRIKKVLIVNPDELTEATQKKTTQVTLPLYQGDAGLTGEYWKDDFKKKVTNIIKLNPNVDPDNPKFLTAFTIGRK